MTTNETMIAAAEKALAAAKEHFERCNAGSSFAAWEKAEFALARAERVYHEALAEAAYGVREDESAY